MTIKNDAWWWTIIGPACLIICGFINYRFAEDLGRITAKLAAFLGPWMMVAGLAWLLAMGAWELYARIRNRRLI